MQPIVQWLEALGLGQYGHAFVQVPWGGWDDLVAETTTGMGAGGSGWISGGQGDWYLAA
jgi:hypothetical protein